MISGFVAQKVQMISTYLDSGARIAATRCHYHELVVSQVKSIDKDCYASLQVAFDGHKKEFKLTTDVSPKVGEKIALNSVFQVGDKIKVTGITKGRGFAGVIKRYGFHRQPVSGGQSDRVRAPGSIGAQTPGKVVKGKKMPGHYGSATKTISNLQILAIDPKSNELLINGPIPGHRRSWVTIHKL